MHWLAGECMHMYMRGLLLGRWGVGGGGAACGMWARHARLVPAASESTGIRVTEDDRVEIKCLRSMQRVSAAGATRTRVACDDER
jgi:hypothetical protein